MALLHPALDGGRGRRPVAILQAQTMGHLRPGMPGAVVGEGILPDVLGEASCSGPRFRHGAKLRKREGRRFRLVRWVRGKSNQRSAVSGQQEMNRQGAKVAKTKREKPQRARRARRRAKSVERKEKREKRTAKPAFGRAYGTPRTPRTEALFPLTPAKLHYAGQARSSPARHRLRPPRGRNGQGRGPRRGR